jgi:hypothetical protein
MFHVARDYRNGYCHLLPFAVGTLFALSSILLTSAHWNINSSVKPALKLIISNNYQNGALSIYATVALFFVMFATLSSRPMVTHASFKKIIASFFIGVLIFLVSSNKSNDLLIFTIAL